MDEREVARAAAEEIASRQKKKRYVKPEIVYRAPLEAMAASCPIISNGKAACVLVHS